MKRYLVLIALLCAAFLGVAQAAPASREERLAEAQKLADNLHYQQGEVTLSGGVAKIKLPDNFRYLNPADSRTVLTRIWGNPDSGQAPLGMLIPTGMSPLGDGTWAVIITYKEDGYVKDGDATKINYDDLLKQMKEDTRKDSEQRIKQGYAPIELVGWATPPRYDAAAHKMYWALDYRFPDSLETTLNYNIRVLGRHGVLVLNVVAATTQLAQIEREAPAILAMVDFKEGHRYVDFKPGTDKVATYGIAGLVAGGLLAKAGFFKMLLVGILALKKFVIVAVVAAGAAIKKLFAKITGRGNNASV